MDDDDDFEFGAAHEEGAYDCIVGSIETKDDERDGHQGEQFRLWTFPIMDEDGQRTGDALSGTTSMLTTPKSKAYAWARGILGRAPDRLRKADLIGTPCIVVIVHEDGEEKIGGIHPAVTVKRQAKAAKPRPRDVDETGESDPRPDTMP